MVRVAMTSHQISIKFSVLNSVYDVLSKKRSYLGLKFLQPTCCYSLPRKSIGFLQDGCKLRVFAERYFLGGVIGRKDGILMRNENMKKRVVVVKVNKGFDFNGGGGGNNNSNNARLLGNLALAIGLTYLSMTGQLGWILDAIVSIWLIAVILPIVGLGAFLWFAGRDIVQDSCPNCGNDFQIFKSSLKDGLQLCPFCSQPFSVMCSQPEDMNTVLGDGNIPVNTIPNKLMCKATNLSWNQLSFPPNSLRHLGKHSMVFHPARRKGKVKVRL
ncbi:uncharacterized protein LOC143893014 isoform X2 [Tasmannia lanceolata]|uniref:uncharacterized protein LOC143893014 isoform X2 n=1 Tax=Tasmannia lanceolata TaxID=3420 RepID=UPI0040639CBA